MRNKFFGLLITFVAFSVVAFPSHAAQFISGQDVKVNKSTTNLYATGNTVKITHDVKRDLVVAAGEASIDSNVERGILAAGTTVRIHSKSTGAAARVAGADVVLTGTYNDDVVVAGNTVMVRDATIAGDLIVGSSTLTIENSKIAGNMYGGYGELVGDLKNQVKGKVFATGGDNKQKSVADLISFPWELSMILGLLILIRFLDSSGRLILSTVRLDRNMTWDILGGLGFLIIPIFALILSFLTLLYPLAIPLALISYSIFVLSFVFLPIYIANFLKNVFKLEYQIKTLSILAYAGLFLIGFIPFLRPLAGVVAVFALASYGYILRSAWGQIRN